MRYALQPYGHTRVCPGASRRSAGASRSPVNALEGTLTSTCTPPPSSGRADISAAIHGGLGCTTHR